MLHTSHQTWDVAAVRDMSLQCSARSTILQSSLSDLGMFQVSQTESVLVLQGCTLQSNPLVRGTVTAVRDRAQSFNRPIGSWNVSQVSRNMERHVRQGCTLQSRHWNSGSAGHELHVLRSTILQQAIGSWDTSAVRDLNCMFYGAQSFNRPFGLWNVSGVETMRGMFAGASSFDQDHWFMGHVCGDQT